MGDETGINFNLKSKNELKNLFKSIKLIKRSVKRYDYIYTCDARFTLLENFQFNHFAWDDEGCSTRWNMSYIYDNKVNTLLYSETKLIYNDSNFNSKLNLENLKERLNLKYTSLIELGVFLMYLLPFKADYNFNSM